MFSWKNSITATGVVATIVSTLINTLPFFRLDAVSFWDGLDKMSGRTVFLLISVLILVVGLVLKWADRKVAPWNAKRKIREWLDNVNLENGVFDFPRWHFTLSVNVSSLRVYVGRPRIHGGRYIVVEARFPGVSKENKTAFAALSKSDKAQLYSHLALETSRAGALLGHNGKSDLSDISIMKRLVMASLKESDLISAIDQVYHSSVIIWNTTALQLSESPKLIEASLESEADRPPEQSPDEEETTD